jgi:6-phosphogluconolactonase
MSEFVVETIQQSARNIGLCRIALAGGSTPRGLYQKLASPGTARRVDWSVVHLFWGDERCVSREDPDSNFGMVKTVLLDHVDIPEQNIHPIDGTLEPKVAAEQYADVIADGPFDLVLLGLGQDGHTASLFPNTPDLSQERRAVIATTSPLPPKHRISLSLKTINAARKVSFFVLGSGKSEVLTRVIAERDLPEPNLPARFKLEAGIGGCANRQMSRQRPAGALSYEQERKEVWPCNQTDKLALSEWPSWDAIWPSILLTADFVLRCGIATPS